jgi:hypothetical protein
MANEPIASERASSEWTEGEPAMGEPAADATWPGGAPLQSTSLPPDMADFNAGAGLMLAALGRMEAAVRGDRLALGRLREALRGMAKSIARAKAALPAHRSDNASAGDTAHDIAILLDEFEHRVDAMIEIAGGDMRTGEISAAGVEAAEQAFVPTVSQVVSRLGRSQDQADDEASAAQAYTRSGSDQVPTVSMLQAMVEALGSSPQEAASDAETPAPSDLDIDAPPAEPVEPMPEPMSEAIPADAIDLERALLANLSRIEAVPLPQEDDVGTAVIFPTALEESGRAEGEADLDPAAFLFESDAASPAAPPSGESAAAPLPADESMRLADAAAPPAEKALPPTDVSLPSLDELQAAPEAAALAAAEPLAAAVTAPPPEPPASDPATAQSEPAQPAANAPPADPLAPLNALSAAERLALFS